MSSSSRKDGTGKLFFSNDFNKKSSGPEGSKTVRLENGAAKETVTNELNSSGGSAASNSTAGRLYIPSSLGGNGGSVASNSDNSGKLANFGISGLKTSQIDTSDSIMSIKKSKAPRISVGYKPPIFNRSPHVITAVKGLEINLPKKNPVGEKPEYNWMTALLPPLLMLVVMITVFFVVGVGSLYFTLPMYTITIFTGIMNFNAQKKKWRKRTEDAESNFLSAQQSVSNQIKQNKNEQATALNKEFPDIPGCLYIVRTLSNMLWRVRPYEDMFLELRLGIGNVKSNIKLQSINNAEENNSIIELAKEVKRVPVTCPIKTFDSVGVVGDRTVVINQIRTMIIQASTHHGFDELKIVLFYPEEEADAWRWIRWLPHVWSDDRQNRLIATTREDSLRLCREMEEIFDKRNSEVSSNEMDNASYLIIVAEKKYISNQPIMNILTADDSEDGVYSIFLAPDRGKLPSSCRAIIETKDGESNWYPTQDINDKHYYEPDKVSIDDCDKFARMIASIYLSDNESSSKFPSSITFMEGYGIKRVEDFNIAELWNSSDYGKSLEVPIGMRGNGETFYFDINRKKDGPHGMVAGGTGSGKSDLVQSWILSMALHFKPTEVSFIIVDYKGDGLLAPFRKLPHLVGTISNLDHKVERNVTALNSELQRRQMLFKESGTHNIEDYIEKYQHGEISTPLPYLIVVMDEFADFKANHPEFIPIVNAIYTLGASLGVYCMILAQDAASAANGTSIPVNSNFRWCMKVNTDDASTGMLGTHDAYTMTKLPGRGYVKIGNFETYEKIQAYWSGAYYNPDKGSSLDQIPPISRVYINGTRIPVSDDSTERDKEMGIWTSVKEIDVIVDYISDYVERNHIEVAKKVWQPPMPENLYLDQLLDQKYKNGVWPKDSSLIDIVLGRVDDPVMQKQYDLIYKFNDSGHIAINGGPESGKTTTLITAALSIAERYSPENVEIYIFDYDKLTTNLIRNLPHVKGSTVAADQGEIKDLVKEIRDEINRRKALFLKTGAISLEGYCQMGNNMPSIVLLIDNIYSAWEDITDVQELIGEVALKGAAYGVYMIATSPGTTFPFKISNLFKTKLSLHQNDKGDYTSIVGRSELVPEDYPGRGLAKIDHPVEMQIALPVFGSTEVDRNNQIHEIVETMKNEWNPKEDKKDPYQMEISLVPGELILGVDEKTFDNVLFDKENKHMLLISSIKSEPLKNILNNLIDQINAINSVELVIFDNKEGDYREKTCYKNFSHNDAEINTYFEKLMSRLEKRSEGGDLNENGKVSPIFLVFADWRGFFEFIENKTVDYLKDIADMGKGLSVYMIVAGLNSRIAYFITSAEKLTYKIYRQRQMIFIGDSIESHRFALNDLSSEVEKSPLDEGKGAYLNGRVCKKIRLL